MDSDSAVLLVGDDVKKFYEQTRTQTLVRTQTITNKQTRARKQVCNRDECHWELNAFRRKRGAQHDTALVIRGCSLRLCIDYYSNEFIELACQASAVVICRCSPTQKAEIVKKLRRIDSGDGKSKRICAIGW